MLKKNYIFVFIFAIFISSYAFSEESLLTLKQQLDRLQREVNDLSQAVYNKSFQPVEDSTQNDETINFSAIDIRIYDLEKDIKNLTFSLEEFTLQFDDLLNSIKSLEENINFQINNINNKITTQNLSDNNEKSILVADDEIVSESNTLGKLVISSDQIQDETIADQSQITVESNNELDQEKDLNLSPEQELQLALDQIIRHKNYEKAINMLKNFINNNSDNQLAGSAHYWLGKVYISESNYREAVFVLGEGVQKFPKSIKAPDMLFELSNSLFAMKKDIEGCKTLLMIGDSYSKSKVSKLASKKITEMDCKNADQ